MSVSKSKKKTKPTYAGLSITQHQIELAVFSQKSLAIEKSFSVPVPSGLFHPEHDMIQNPELLKKLLSDVLSRAKLKPAKVHLSLPGTLLRMVDMPKMDTASLYVSLSNEAERYKLFDDTEAIVDFVLLDSLPVTANNLVPLVLGATRKDSLSIYLKCLKELKVKPVSIGLEPLNVLRGMAGSGVLDSLVQQIGSEANWGITLVEDGRVRFMVWRVDQLLELRELTMDTQAFASATPAAAIVDDLAEEMQRTSKKNKPTIWLTYNMPEAMQNCLANKIDVPVTPVPMGNAVTVLQQPITLAALGAAMTSIVPFPFDLDLSEGAQSVASTVAAVNTGSGDDAGKKAAATWLMPLGGAILALGGIVSFILFLMATMTAQQIAPLQSDVDSIKMEVAGLKNRESELSKKAQLDQLLLSRIKLAKAKNHAFVSLTEDLKHNIPKELWLQSLTVGDTMEMLGKALTHKPVIYFAKSFDLTPYAKGIKIDSIMENRVGANLVYDFEISGTLNLNEETQSITDNATEQPPDNLIENSGA